MERGQAMFTAEAMLALAAAFDVTPADLFPWPEGIERLEASRVAGQESAGGERTDRE
jgi:hypothetical protein